MFAAALLFYVSEKAKTPACGGGWGYSNRLSILKVPGGL